MRWELRAAWCVTWCLATRPIAAQSALSLDAGVAHVEYEGYLPSGVATVSPAINVLWPRASLDVRGTISRFSSGNIAAQGTLSGSLFSRAFGAFRGEVFGLAGGTSHETVGSTRSVLAHARVHWLDPRRRGGVWLGGGLGQNRDPLATRGILQATGGAWLRRGPLTLSTTLRPTRFDEGEYLESEALARFRSRYIDLAAGVGARSGAQIGERSAWGEAEAVIWMLQHVGLVGGLASFPSDPTRGLLGGRSAAVALRFSTRSPPVATPERPPSMIAPVAVTEFELVTLRDETRTVRIRAPAATSVELMADFTAWTPVSLTKVSAGLWELTHPIPSGPHLVNIRVDGGAWRAPAGVTVTVDDFGGEVGLVVVP